MFVLSDIGEKLWVSLTFKEMAANKKKEYSTLYFVIDCMCPSYYLPSILFGKVHSKSIILDVL